MKALVTGSAGFIGSHIVERLVNDGWDVIGIDDFSAGKEDNIRGLDFRQERMDVCSKRVEKYLKDVDVIFHNAASKKNICLHDPHRDLEVNAGGTLNLLQLAVKNGVKKFIHASTGSVYGEPVIFPQKENHPLNPCSYYGVSKLAGERYVSMFNKLYGLDTTILRYFHVFGPRQDSSDDRGGVIAIFARRAKKELPLIIFGDGNQQRSFTSVDNVVRANLFVVENPKALGKVYNVASGLKITINETADLIKRYFDSDSEIIHKEKLTGDIYRFEVDNSRLKNDGFEFRQDFERVLVETCDSI